jgi:hypothetical protein
MGAPMRSSRPRISSALASPRAGHVAGIGARPRCRVRVNFARLDSGTLQCYLAPRPNNPKEVSIPWSRNVEADMWCKARRWEARAQDANGVRRNSEPYENCHDFFRIASVIRSSCLVEPCCATTPTLPSGPGRPGQPYHETTQRTRPRHAGLAGPAGFDIMQLRFRPGSTLFGPTCHRVHLA